MGTKKEIRQEILIDSFVEFNAAKTICLKEKYRTF